MTKAKFIEINVDKKGEGEKVKVKVPFGILKTGVKFAKIVPKNAHAKINDSLKSSGIDFDISSIDSENLEQLVDELYGFSVNVESENEVVSIRCE